MEDPDINPHTCEHLIFDKEAKNIKWNKESTFNLLLYIFTDWPEAAVP